MPNGKAAGDIIPLNDVVLNRAAEDVLIGLFTTCAQRIFDHEIRFSAPLERSHRSDVIVDELDAQEYKKFQEFTKKYHAERTGLVAVAKALLLRGFSITSQTSIGIVTCVAEFDVPGCHYVQRVPVETIYLNGERAVKNMHGREARSAILCWQVSRTAFAHNRLD